MERIRLNGTGPLRSRRWKRFVLVAECLLLSMSFAQSHSDEGAHVLALDNSWNRALESIDTRALDLLLAQTFVSVDIDGSMQSKSEFLASIKSPDYHPPAQAVTEQSTVEVYGDSAVVVGIFRSQGMSKGKKYVNRERFVDTWAKINGTWKCVAAITVLIPSSQSVLLTGRNALNAASREIVPSGGGRALDQLE
jgi:ketosteroid isomerase-like protein